MSARDGAQSRYGDDKYRIAQMFDGPEDLVIRPGLVLGDGGTLRPASGVRRAPPGRPARRWRSSTVPDRLHRGPGRGHQAAWSREITGTVTVAEPEPVEFRVLLAELARLLGVQPWFVPVPERPVAWAMRGLGWLASTSGLVRQPGRAARTRNVSLSRTISTVSDWSARLPGLVEGDRGKRLTWRSREESDWSSAVLVIPRQPDRRDHVHLALDLLEASGQTLRMAPIANDSRPVMAASRAPPHRPAGTGAFPDPPEAHKRAWPGRATGRRRHRRTPAVGSRGRAAGSPRRSWPVTEDVEVGRGLRPGGGPRTGPRGCDSAAARS